MFLTKSRLLQIIEEEYSRAIERRCIAAEATAIQSKAHDPEDDEELLFDEGDEDVDSW